MLIALTLEKSQLSKLLIALTQGCRSDTRKHQELMNTSNGKFFIFAGANLKKKKEKKKEKRGRRRKEKKRRETEKEINFYIPACHCDETAPLIHGTKERNESVFPLLDDATPSYILSTHTLSNSCKWRFKQSYWWSKPARRGGVARRRRPPSNATHPQFLHHVACKELHTFRPVDRVLSGSRRRILDAPHDSIHHPIHHPPSDPPSII